MTDARLLDELRRATLFARLPDDEMIELMAVVRRETWRKGDLIFREADPMERLYVVLAGWVTLYRDTPDGQRAVLRVLGPGESFAEAAIFLHGNYPATAEAAQDAELVSIDQVSFERLLARSPRIAAGIIASLSMHLHALTVEVEQLKTRTGEERLAAFLLSCCQGDRQETSTFDLPYDKWLIAQRLGMQPESLSRNLSRLASQGVSVDRNRVTIDDPVFLAKCVADGSLRRSHR